MGSSEGVGGAECLCVTLVSLNSSGSYSKIGAKSQTSSLDRDSPDRTTTLCSKTAHYRSPYSSQKRKITLSSLYRSYNGRSRSLCLYEAGRPCRDSTYNRAR